MSFSHFASPLWFLLLLAVVGLLLGYVFVLRQRRRRTLVFSNLPAVAAVAGARRSFTRHVPTALILLAVALLTVAIAGPMDERKSPRNRATVVLAIDVSMSMEATDVAPSRLEVAQRAGKEFADGLTAGINLGLVAFSGTASVMVSPTTDRNAIKAAIDKLELGERTATGEAIFTSLLAIDTLATMVTADGDPPPAHIVLLSDGQQTVPELPTDPRGAFTAAQKARDQSVPVSTIAFGTTYGSVEIEGSRIPVPVDAPSLREIARIAHGTFYEAASLDELSEVYDNLEEQIGYETSFGDASRPWMILATLVLIGAAGSALLINQRLP